MACISMHLPFSRSAVEGRCGRGLGYKHRISKWGPSVTSVFKMPCNLLPYIKMPYKDTPSLCRRSLRELVSGQALL